MTTKTDDIKLLPCPFCGGEAEMDAHQYYLNITTGHPGDRIAIYCTECGADMGICREDVHDITPEQVADMWNRRAAVEADRQRSMPSDDEISDLWAECTIDRAVTQGKTGTMLHLFARALLSKYGNRHE